ncbi:zf-u1-domain-containing protein [Phaffia rhodozyma]|uniref:U1 small nuclear ribonucleoprotein C n=1 Tax=Phaffia rhodozyma TaxID=264483 RepID=A0A0F7SFY8_PHARH|nr:zf-u1-domain-containing protein [Phaffia rhodozyma]
MPKYYCDYCDVFLTHDSASVRKAHNAGRNHLQNVRDYYASLGHDKAQDLIDQIINSHANGPPGGGMMGGAPAMRMGPGFLNPSPAYPSAAPHQMQPQYRPQGSSFPSPGPYSYNQPSPSPYPPSNMGQPFRPPPQGFPQQGYPPQQQQQQPFYPPPGQGMPPPGQSMPPLMMTGNGLPPPTLSQGGLPQRPPFMPPPGIGGGSPAPAAPPSAGVGMAVNPDRARMMGR